MLRTPKKEKQVQRVETITASSSEELYGRIAQRAYQFYEERGHVNGDAMADWLRAEKEILFISAPDEKPRPARANGANGRASKTRKR